MRLCFVTSLLVHKVFGATCTSIDVLANRKPPGHRQAWEDQRGAILRHILVLIRIAVPKVCLLTINTSGPPGLSGLQATIVVIRLYVNQYPGMKLAMLISLDDGATEMLNVSLIVPTPTSRSPWVLGTQVVKV